MTSVKKQILKSRAFYGFLVALLVVSLTLFSSFQDRKEREAFRETSKTRSEESAPVIQYSEKSGKQELNCPQFMLEEINDTTKHQYAQSMTYSLNKLMSAGADSIIIDAFADSVGASFFANSEWSLSHLEKESTVDLQEYFKANLQNVNATELTAVLKPDEDKLQNISEFLSNNNFTHPVVVTAKNSLFNVILASSSESQVQAVIDIFVEDGHVVSEEDLILATLSGFDTVNLSILYSNFQGDPNFVFDVDENFTSMSLVLLAAFYDYYPSAVFWLDKGVDFTHNLTLSTPLDIFRYKDPFDANNVNHLAIIDMLKAGVKPKRQITIRQIKQWLPESSQSLGFNLVPMQNLLTVLQNEEFTQIKIRAVQNFIDSIYQTDVQPVLISCADMVLSRYVNLFKSDSTGGNKAKLSIHDISIFKEGSSDVESIVTMLKSGIHDAESAQALLASRDNIAAKVAAGRLRFQAISMYIQDTIKGLEIAKHQHETLSEANLLSEDDWEKAKEKLDDSDINDNAKNYYKLLFAIKTHQNEVEIKNILRDGVAVELQHIIEIMLRDNLKALETILDFKSIPLTFRDKYDRNLLWYATSNTASNCFYYLLSRGADVNSPSTGGLDTLDQALYNALKTKSNFDFIDKLLAGGKTISYSHMQLFKTLRLVMPEYVEQLENQYNFEAK